MTSCATLSFLDPFDDKEDVLVTDVSVEPARKARSGRKASPKTSSKSSSKSPRKALRPKRSDTDEAGAPRRAPLEAQDADGLRIAQNLPESSTPLNLFGGGAFDAAAPDICTMGITSCDDEGETTLQPTICELDVGADRDPMATWGASPCSARRQMTAELCRQSYKGVVASDIVCAPESAMLPGTCPPPTVSCGPDERPIVCTAKSYQGSMLQFSQYPKAWGEGTCATRANLRAFACSLKLDPSQLGDITCEPDTTGGECPVSTDQLCSDDEDQEFFVCEAKSYVGKLLDVPLVTYGESRCEAKAALMHMACQYSDSTNRLRPSQLENINCYSELSQVRTEAP